MAQIDYATYEEASSMPPEKKRFFLDEDTGLFVPLGLEASSSKGVRQTERNRVDQVKTLISVLTLFFLILTVVYTRRQWLEANRASNSSEISAHAAESAAVVAKATLEEMRSGSTSIDTHTLAEQSEQQAANTHILALEERAQAKGTERLASQASMQAEATNELAIQAARTADAASEDSKRALTMQRPWVGLAEPLKRTGSRGVIGQNSFEEQFDLTLKNFGSLAAGNVVAGVRLTYSPLRVAATQREACKVADAFMHAGNGALIFPISDTVILPSSITESQIDSLSNQRDGVVYATVCIVYQDFGGTTHHTKLCQQQLDVPSRPSFFEACAPQSAD